MGLNKFFFFFFFFFYIERKEENAELKELLVLELVGLVIMKGVVKFRVMRSKLFI